MKIRDDYSYVNNPKLVEMGLAEYGVHSLNIGRYYSEEEKEANRKKAEIMDRKSWGEHVDDVGRKMWSNISKILSTLNDNMSLYQYDKEVGYKDNWGLFYWSDIGWNNEDYGTSVKLSPNDSHSQLERKEKINSALEIIKKFESKNLSCRVQYELILDEKKIKELANKLFNEVNGGWVEFIGKIGRIKEIEHRENHQYGFFKKGARTKYNPLSDVQVIKLLTEV